MLSDADIIARVDDGSLMITPFDPLLVQPSSIDVRLARSFRMFNPYYDSVDPANIPADLFVEVQEPGKTGISLHPGEFLLGCTAESVSLPNDLAAVTNGKSSLGRLGLQVHATAGFVDPGFSGQITLELANVGALPIQLKPGILIAQLCFLKMSSSVTRPYGTPELRSHYQNQRGATPPASV